MLQKKAIVLAVLVGLLLGTGAFTFKYAEGLSYFSTDPKACVNCHIMTPQYDSWQKSSHHAVATCVDRCGPGCLIEPPVGDKIRVGSLGHTRQTHAQHGNKRNDANQLSVHNNPPYKRVLKTMPRLRAKAIDNDVHLPCTLFILPRKIL